MSNQMTWHINSAFLLNTDIPPKSVWKKHAEWIQKKHDEGWDKENETGHEVDVIIRFKKRGYKLNQLEEKP